MKFAFIATALATGIAFAGPALADGRGHHGGGHGKYWQQLDANQDGKIEKSEFDAHLQARFKEADANGDGKISFEESEAAREKRRTEHRKARFDAMDKDGDGALSAAEASDKATRMWIRADRDDDDVLELDNMRGRHGDMRRGSRDERRGRGDHPMRRGRE
jgi:hypothetical protein